MYCTPVVRLDNRVWELIYRGVWDGLSTQEAMELYPDEWERFLADPYAHRAPRAESYHDLSGESADSALSHKRRPKADIQSA